MLLSLFGRKAYTTYRRNVCRVPAVPGVWRVNPHATTKRYRVLAELPELEATRRIITPEIENSTIESVRVLRPDRVPTEDGETLPERVEGQVISSLNRKGKMLTLSTQSGGTFVMHFRMKGLVHLMGKDEPELEHTLVVLGLDNGMELRMVDDRCLSFFWYIEPDYEGEMPFDKLGPDALTEKMSVEYLRDSLGHRARNLKTCLLDQRIIAGIGNVYVDEVLFESCLSPLRQASTLTDDDLDRLSRTIPRVMRIAVERLEKNPDKLRVRSRTRVRKPDFAVNGKLGLQCRKCNAPLVRVKVGGRSTMYCPSCQK